MIVSIVCIAIHQIAFILSLTVWRGYTVYPAMFLRPAGMTDEAAAAAIAAAEAAPDIIRYWANSFVWLPFIIFAGRIFRQFVPWEKVSGGEKRVSRIVLAVSVILVLTVTLINRYAYTGPLYLWLGLIPTEILSLMCIVLLYAKKRFRGGAQNA